ncbi:MAG: carbohydrate ABC transporter permease, partial [Pseudomonadota bacterium]
WLFVVATTVAVAMSFASGELFSPSLLLSLVWGVVLALVALKKPGDKWVKGGVVIALFVLTYAGLGPLFIGDDVAASSRGIGALLLALAAVVSLWKILEDCPFAALNRHEFEEAVIRFLTGFGFIVFTAAVLIPFYVMVMTSLKSQQALLANPLDFSIDLSRGLDLFRSYIELFRDFNFGSYLWTSFFVSVLTVLITLLFSVPGAYAVARLRFKGQAVFSRSILLIYMVPMIVLALPIYIAFSVTGLRNTISGLVLIYPVTTIPVALYMLQGYFRGLPVEVEEAGLMDGLSRLQVILKITLPLSLPAMVSVSLYVFMIAWNEFLLAFMLLDDPSKFTLTRGVAMLNSSEIPRQHLMAGAVIATIPIMVLFLGLERFMTKGLTAGSVKG